VQKAIQDNRPCLIVTTPQIGEDLTEDDLFWRRWAIDSRKANLQLANDVLRQMVTLSATILGAGVVFLTKDVIPERFIVPVLLAFLFSLGFSFWGILPYFGMPDITSPDEIKKHKLAALKHKLDCMRAGALFFVGALLGAVLGVLAKVGGLS
jgi:hypothetical protein